MDRYKRKMNDSDRAASLGDKQRDYLLSAYKETVLLLDYTKGIVAEAGDTVSNSLTLYRQKLADCVADLRNAYREGVPFVELSRCPISGDVLRRSLDIYGLDGLWWDNRNPIRPREQLNATLLAFTGAMKLSEDLEFASFLVKPGPGVPFVIPRLFSHNSVQAVLSSVPVGKHTGFVIAYFADPLPENFRRANDWGWEQYEVIRKDGQTGWDSIDEIEDDYDFDLSRWIEQGRLLWIYPGDSEMNLHEGKKDCPYIDIEGIREVQRIKEGTLWYPSLVRNQNDTN